jgi:hypothetical protein
MLMYEIVCHNEPDQSKYSESIHVKTSQYESNASRGLVVALSW